MPSDSAAKPFPKWKYPADGSAGKVVHDTHEEAELGPGWADDPVPARDDGQLTLIAHLVARPDKVEATKAFLLALVEKTRQESGCIEYHLHQTENPQEFMFYESWINRAEWDLHMTRPYVQEIAARADELLSGSPRIELMRMISPRR